MRISDAIIIYLAAGSPFAVHYFFRIRRQSTFINAFWVISRLLFWPFYAIWLTLRVKLTERDRFVISTESNLLDAGNQKKVDAAAAALEIFLPDSLPEMPLFECREVVERYTALTLASRSIEHRPDVAFPHSIIVSDEDRDLNAICRDRRNRNALKHHQICARRDFLNMVTAAIETDGPESAFVRSALELCRLITDEAAYTNIAEISGEREQMPVKDLVNIMEGEVWRSQTPKQTAASRI